jgi:membrane-associated phospholipid phosphatase
VSVWDFVTDFGDSAVTVPLALLVFVFLWAAAARRIALGWAVATGGCAVTMGALKVLFTACGPEIADITSPSGHTAMSVVVYGALATLIGARLRSERRRIVSITAGVAIVGISLSRWVLRDHTAAEITVGFGVGTAALVLFRIWLGRDGAPPLPLKWLALSAACLVAIMHGIRWKVEPTVHRLAWDIRAVLPWCR